MVSIKKNKHIISIVLVILAIVVVVMLAPVFYASKFAYPWSDDFSYGADARAALLSTGSIFKAILAAIKNTKDTYFNWQGTYTSCFLMSVQPAIWSMKLYHLTGAGMLVALFLSYLSLGLVLMKKILRMSWQASVSIILLAYFASVEAVAGIAEAFTWYNSAVHYTFMHALLIFLVSMVLNFLCDFIRKAGEMKNAEIVRRTILLCGLAIISAGGNFITTLGGALVLAIMESSVLFYYLVYSKKENKAFLMAAMRMLPVVFAYFTGFLVNVLAPGNGERMASAGDTGLKTDYLAVIGRAFQVSFMTIQRRLSVDLLMVMLLVAILIWFGYTREHALDNVNFSFPLPGLVLLISYCLMAAIYCPEILVVDTSIELEFLYKEATCMARTENVVYFCLVILLMINLVYSLGWLYKKGVHSGSNIISLILAAVAVIVCADTCKGEITSREKEYLTSTAIGDIKDQTLQYYDYQMTENTARLMSDEKNVLVMPIAVNPDSVYPYDASDWIEGTRGYYQKDSVTYESEPYVFTR